MSLQVFKSAVPLSCTAGWQVFQAEQRKREDRQQAVQHLCLWLQKGGRKQTFNLPVVPTFRIIGYNGIFFLPNFWSTSTSKLKFGALQDFSKHFPPKKPWDSPLGCFSRQASLRTGLWQVGAGLGDVGVVHAGGWSRAVWNVIFVQWQGGWSWRWQEDWGCPVWAPKILGNFNFHFLSAQPFIIEVCDRKSTLCALEVLSLGPLKHWIKHGVPN